jgi:predicted phosphodiesterase
MISKHEGDIDLSWSEINDMLGLDYSPCHTRKLSYGVVLYHNLLKNNKIHEDISDDASEKLIEIRKERVKLNDLRNEINRQVRSQARFEDMISAMTYSINQLNNNNPFYDTPVTVSSSENKKEMIISLADLHYGLSINDNWNTYNSNIAIERMNKIVNKAMNIGNLHNCKIVHLLVCGDMLNNNIHLTSRLSNRENVTSQIVGVSELLSNAIARLSNKFNYVIVHITSGNHDRIIPKKEDNDYDDNFANIIKEFIKIRVENLSNVILDENIFGHDIVKFNVCGKVIIGTHGDKIPNNQAITRLSTMFGKVDYAIQGHYHHNSISSVGDSKVITVGSFSGTDRYAREKGLVCRPTQKILILEDNSNDEILYEIDLSNN